MNQNKTSKKQLPVLERVKKRPIFQAATHNGRKFVAAGLVLQALPNLRDTEAMRVGFTTTRKLGCAVVRNRIRRRLKAVAQIVLPPEALVGYDYIIVGRKAAFDRPFEMLLKDLRFTVHQFRRSLTEKPMISLKKDVLSLPQAKASDS